MEIFGLLPPKASKNGLLGQKSDGLFKFGHSGGLINNGLLFARIRHMYILWILDGWISSTTDFDHAFVCYVVYCMIENGKYSMNMIIQ